MTLLRPERDRVESLGKEIGEHSGESRRGSRGDCGERRQRLGSREPRSFRLEMRHDAHQGAEDCISLIGPAPGRLEIAEQIRSERCHGRAAPLHGPDEEVARSLLAHSRVE